MRATAIGSMMMKWRITKSCRPLRGLDVRLRNIPGVPPSATPQAIFCRPHPRAQTYVLRVKMWVKTRLYTAACLVRRHGGHPFGDMVDTLAPPNRIPLPERRVPVPGGVGGGERPHSASNVAY